MVVMPMNYEEIENVIVFASKYGFSHINLLPPIISEKKQCKCKLEKETIETLIKKREKFEEIAKKNNIHIDNKLPAAIEYAEVYNKDEYRMTYDQINDEKNTQNIDKKYDSLKEIYELDNNLADIDKFEIKKENRIFCLRPFKTMVIDWGKQLPSCVCSKQSYSNNNIENIKNSIFYCWNNKDFQYYRKCMIKQKQIYICSEECLANKNNFLDY